MSEYSARQCASLAIGLLMAASACAQAPAQDVLRSLNRLRAPGGPCAATAPPLMARRTLDTAAARIATGASLDAAFGAAGYRMTEAQVITLRGDGLFARLDALLAPRFCAQIGSAKLSEAGVHARGDQIWIVLAAPFAPTVSLTRRQLAERMLTLVNEARAVPRRCGDMPMGAAQPVHWNEALEVAAAGHAADMAANDYFSHTARDGSTPAQRITRAGYRFREVGENIAAGQRLPEDAVASWIKSPGHCAILMNSAYVEMGVALAVSASSQMGTYWVQIFGAAR